MKDAFSGTGKIKKDELFKWLFRCTGDDPGREAVEEEREMPPPPLPAQSSEAEPLTSEGLEAWCQAAAKTITNLGIEAAKAAEVASDAERDAKIASADASIKQLEEACGNTRELLGKRMYVERPSLIREQAAELALAEEQIKLERENQECTFWFVRADFIRAWTGTTLPPFQELRGKLEKRKITRSEAFRAVHRHEFLAISHRWEDPKAPDGQGVQMKAIKTYLEEHHEVEFVWYDYWCMPQGKERTPAETVQFKWMLHEVNLLYLGCSVLCLVDISYSSRFWTQFEAWLSMQAASIDGLRAASSDRRRCTIKCIHNHSWWTGMAWRNCWTTESSPVRRWNVLPQPCRR